MRPWGIVLLVATAATYLVTPPGWLAIGLAAAAWVVLARDRALGPLPAAVAIVLALPYDRAADADLLRLASIPVRPHDVVIGLALVTSLPNLRRIRWSPGTRLLLGFLALGVAALALGILNDHPLRDILRDARWWGLYAGGLFSAGGGVRPAALLRGMFIGLAVFGGLLIVTALLPGVVGGLKLRAMAFDLGVLRLHFGPTAFLLVPVAYLSGRLLTAGAWRHLALWLLLLCVGLGLSVTRVTSVVLFVVVALGIVLALLGGIRRPALRMASPLAVAAAGVALALAVGAVGVQVPHAAEIAGQEVATASPSPTPELATTPAGDATPAPTPTHTPTNPITRFTFDAGQLLLALTDRFESYASAVALIGESPVIGHGMGVLVEVDYEFGAGEFATEYRLPNVDNAYLTMAMKAGVIGSVAFAALVLWPAWRLARGVPRLATRLLLPAWIGLLMLTLTQGFAVIGHSPFVIGLLIAAVEGLPAHGKRSQASVQMSRNVSSSV